MKPILNAAGRTADLEATLSAREQELRECEARYEELRHRIENDLQVLSSAFSMLARIRGEADNCVHCLSRVRSTAALYHALDLTGADVISMGDYLSALSDALFNSFGDRIAIASVVDGNINLDQRRAQRVGLIYAEAAMNAVKHAFPNDAGGRVEVRFRCVGDAFEMTVSDDGVGFSPDSAQSGHGLNLMKQFAQQLDGSLQLEKLQAGTRVKLTFAADV